MNKILLFLLLLPISAFSQKEKPDELEASLSKGYIGLTEDWSYILGDNPDWADPEFDDSSWKKISDEYLKYPIAENASEESGIVWFRKTMRFDSKEDQQLIMRIYQTGASEIYLDGKLIHKLGTVSANPDDVISYNPGVDLLEFPLVRKTKNVLAVRYVNVVPNLPIYDRGGSGIRIYMASLKVATSDNYYHEQLYKYYIVIGVGSFMAILFFCYFIFFPNEKINLYFSFSSLLFTLFIISLLSLSVVKSGLFWCTFLMIFFASAYIVVFLFTFYKVFNLRPGLYYRIIFAFSILAIIMHFIISGEMIVMIAAILMFADTIRLSIGSLKTDKMRAVIFLLFNSLSVLFWAVAVLSIFANLKWPIFQYQPFALLLGPMSIAIYLGYSFGGKSETLRLKLAEVEQLSEEKQQLLANQNEMLERQVDERTAELNASLNHLNATQAQLIQSEKMASLGELTAGIAHEIQNPLNFVTNFSEVSNEMIDEILDENQKPNVERDEELVSEILSDIKQNLEKINHHGKRADAIVKGMLQHSRSSSGKKELTDINALADEYLRLAYHGLRAKDNAFNAELVTNFDENLPKANVIPQEIGRVLLNLLTNAFYATQDRKKSENSDFKSVVEVATSLNGDSVQITVKDNGNGIPENIKEKIFQPFFTTKPTGEGTGLGLSLAYDIVTKGHSGALNLKSVQGEGSAFTITIPIHN